MTVPPRRSRSSWSLAAGMVIGAVMLVIAIRQVDWPAVVSALTQVSPAWLLLAALASAATQALLAFRWFVLIGRENGMSFGDAFDFLAIGALAGLVLPPRLSDVARAVAAGRYHSTSATGLFGTIVVERLCDVFMLVLFGVGVSAMMPVPPLLRAALPTLSAIAAAAVVVLWLGERGPLGLLARGAGRWRGPQSRVHAWAAKFLAGTGVIRERGRLPIALLITLAAWLFAAASAGILMAAFASPVPWFAGAFTIVLINLAGILPAPPAGIGVYHYAAMSGASPWLNDASTAFAFALVSHAMSAAVVIILGTGGLARKGLSIGGLRRMAASESMEKPS